MAKKDNLHFLFFGISGNFRRRLSICAPGINGSELVRSKCTACDCIICGTVGTVRNPSPISSSSSLLLTLLLVVCLLKFNDKFLFEPVRFCCWEIVAATTGALLPIGDGFVVDSSSKSDESLLDDG